MLDRMIEPLTLWEHLAGIGVDGPSTVAVAPGSRICPQGWCGIVHLDGHTLATAPTPELARSLRTVLEALDPAAHTDADALATMLDLAQVRGPATLAYLREDDFRPVPTATVTRMPAEDPAVRALLARAGPEETGQSGLAALPHPLFVHLEQGRALAAAGYKLWPKDVAHLSVLTDPAHRGRGLATRVASTAIAHALTRDLLPQWRARPPASRRVALRSGFQERGSQLSLSAR